MRKLLVGMCVLGVCALFVAPVVAGTCSCPAIAESGEGFCDACNKGQIFSENVTSRKLYEVLHGHSVDAAKITCDGCKRAHEKSGTCSACKAGFANNRMYHSPVAHHMAMGKTYTAAKAADCSGCKEAFSKNSMCSPCNVGFVGGRIYHTRSRHSQAVSAAEIIHAASAKKCQDCAVAMVTNSKCDKCGIRFQNGHALRSDRKTEGRDGQ